MTDKKNKGLKKLNIFQLKKLKEAEQIQRIWICASAPN